MKKKLFLVTLMVALFVCLFAISASAGEFKSDFTEEVTKFYEEDGTTESLPEWSNLTDKNATAVLKLADESYIRIPLYYIYQVNGTSFYGDIRDTSNTGSAGFKYAWISEKLGETVNHANLVALEIPEGITGVQNQFGTESTIYSALEELVISSSVTSLPSKMLRDNITLRKIFIKQVRNEDGTVQGVTKIPDYFADRKESKNPSALEYFALELDYCTSFGANAFNKTYIKEIRIEAPITVLNGFSNCEALETVYINNTGEIITMAQKAFAYDTALKSVTLNGISLSNYAFELTAGTGTQGGLTFKATNVTYMGEMPFKNLSNLESVDISGPITQINGSAFNNCTNLKTVRIYNTSDTAATGGNNLCDKLPSVTTVTLHGITVGTQAFREVSTLTSVSLTGNIPSIGQEAFFKTGITTVTIPGSVSSIGNKAFQYCPNLAEVYFLASNEGVELSSVGSNIFGTDNDKTSNTALKKVVFDKDCNITTIGVYMFYYCQALEFLSMPDSVTSIQSQAFLGCKALGPLYLSPNITSIHSTDIFENCNNMYFSESFFTDPSKAVKAGVYYFPDCITTLSTELFKYCNNLNETIVFGESLTSVTNGYAFARNNATTTLNVVFLGNVTNLKTDKEAYKTNFYFCAEGATMEAITFNNTQKGDCYAYVCSQGVYRALKDSTTTAMTDADHLIMLENQSQDATCTENKMTFDACFCGARLNAVEVENSALGHDLDYSKEGATAALVSVNYNGNYATDGTKVVCCGREGCGSNETLTADAIFSGFVYATREAKSDNICGLVLTYNINREALADFEGVSSQSLTFGVLAIAEKNVSGNPLNSDGTPALEKIVAADLTETGISTVDLIIKGNDTAWSAPLEEDETKTTKDVPFYILGYVIDSEGLSYFHGETSSADITTLETITYNEATSK